MPEIPTEVPGKLIKDLCEALGLDPVDVFRLEIEPRGVIVAHAFRRNPEGKMIVGAGDMLTQTTHIKIRWSK